MACLLPENTIILPSNQPVNEASLYTISNNSVFTTSFGLPIRVINPEWITKANQVKSPSNDIGSLGPKTKLFLMSNTKITFLHKLNQKVPGGSHDTYPIIIDDNIESTINLTENLLVYNDPYRSNETYLDKFHLIPNHIMMNNILSLLNFEGLQNVLSMDHISQNAYSNIMVDKKLFCFWNLPNVITDLVCNNLKYHDILQLRASNYHLSKYLFPQLFDKVMSFPNEKFLSTNLYDAKMIKIHDKILCGSIRQHHIKHISSCFKMSVIKIYFPNVITVINPNDYKNTNARYALNCTYNITNTSTAYRYFIANEIDRLKDTSPGKKYREYMTIANAAWYQYKLDHYVAPAKNTSVIYPSSDEDLLEKKNSSSSSDEEFPEKKNPSSSSDEDLPEKKNPSSSSDEEFRTLCRIIREISPQGPTPRGTDEDLSEKKETSPNDELYYNIRSKSSCSKKCPSTSTSTDDSYATSSEADDDESE